MTLLQAGVFGTSQKKYEKRVPIHPDQIKWIAEDVRKQLLFEKGYGLPFGMSDDKLAGLSGGVVCALAKSFFNAVR
jgi:alanine dehydrogenase